MENINITWWGDNGNWGDILNPHLVSLLSGIDKDNINKIHLEDDSDSYNKYYCIGSILNHTYSNNYEVWGSGIENPFVGLQSKPKKIHAVRGPLTRETIINQGYECPEIYGDPALLYSRFYTPKVNKKYKYGIIPHFLHKDHPWLDKFKDNPEVIIIDVQDFTINRFVDQINECEIIFSSALHGIICADSYNIPSYWIDLSDGGQVNKFKFHDYFLSVGRPLIEPIVPKKDDQIQDFLPLLYNYSTDIDLDKLLEACPFKKPNLMPLDQKTTIKHFNPNSIPVIGTAIVNGVNWLERLIDSVDYPVENFIIFNNNGRDQITDELNSLIKKPHNFIKNIKVCHLPSNIGVAAVWNLIIKSYLNASYWIICNHDVAFEAGFLEEMVQASQKEDIGIVHGKGGDFNVGSFDLFLIKDWVVQKLGLFDENLYPAYGEDVDYIMRIHNNHVERILNLEKSYYHGDSENYYEGGSQTRKQEPELEEKLDHATGVNFGYLTEKWSIGWRQVNPQYWPFGIKDFDQRFYKFDLEKAREKYLGF